MAAGDELKDPWGWLVAGISGGIGWAVLAPLGPIAIPVAIGIGAAVLGTKVAIGSRNHAPDDSGKRPGQLPKPPAHSPQANLLAQAEVAQRRIRALADAPGDDWLAVRIGTVDDEVAIVRSRLTELAGRITVADASVQSARPDVLADDRARLAAAVAAETDPSLRQERERTLQALDSQLESVTRLRTLRDKLLSRMQTAVLGLEGLAARMGELVALGDESVTHDRSAEVVAQVTSDLDTVRAGLTEAEDLARRLP